MVDLTSILMNKLRIAAMMIGANAIVRGRIRSVSSEALGILNPMVEWRREKRGSLSAANRLVESGPRSKPASDKNRSAGTCVFGRGRRPGA